MKVHLHCSTGVVVDYPAPLMYCCISMCCCHFPKVYMLQMTPCFQIYDLVIQIADLRCYFDTCWRRFKNRWLLWATDFEENHNYNPFSNRIYSFVFLLNPRRTCPALSLWVTSMLVMRLSTLLMSRSRYRVVRTTGTWPSPAQALSLALTSMIPVSYFE